MTIEELTKKLADEGNLIEAGWVALKFATLKDAPEIQVKEMRKAYFAGAAHLFSSILSFLEEDENCTGKDLHRMEMIHVELKAFEDALRRELAGIKETA